MLGLPELVVSVPRPASFSEVVVLLPAEWWGVGLAVGESSGDVELSAE